MASPSAAAFPPRNNIDELPSEIISSILSYAIEPSTAGGANILRTNRTFYLAGQRYLYEEINICSETGWKSFDMNWDIAGGLKEDVLGKLKLVKKIQIGFGFALRPSIRRNISLHHSDFTNLQTLIVSRETLILSPNQRMKRVNMETRDSLTSWLGSLEPTIIHWNVFNCFPFILYEAKAISQPSDSIQELRIGLFPFEWLVEDTRARNDLNLLLITNIIIPFPANLNAAFYDEFMRAVKVLIEFSKSASTRRIRFEVVRFEGVPTRWAEEMDEEIKKFLNFEDEDDSVTRVEGLGFKVECDVREGPDPRDEEEDLDVSDDDDEEEEGPDEWVADDSDDDE